MWCHLMCFAKLLVHTFSIAEVGKHTETLQSIDADNKEMENSLQQIPKELQELEEQLETEKENMLQSENCQ